MMDRVQAMVYMLNGHNIKVIDFPDDDYMYFDSDNNRFMYYSLARGKEPVNKALNSINGYTFFVPHPKPQLPTKLELDHAFPNSSVEIKFNELIDYLKFKEQ